MVGIVAIAGGAALVTVDLVRRKAA